MITSNNSSPCSLLVRTALITLGCAFSLAIIQLPSAKAADTPAPMPMADKLASLPVTTAFEKVASGENKGGYVLKVTNTSKEALKIHTTISPSVTFHANAKLRNLPEQTIAPGKTWTVDDLAAADKVTIAADGFSPLELTVP